jgi:hypothetical protein
MVMIKPQGTSLVIGKVGDDIPFLNVDQASLHVIGLDPFYRFCYIFRFIQKRGAYNAVKVWSGYNTHTTHSQNLGNSTIVKIKDLLIALGLCHFHGMMEFWNSGTLD